ncbi:MAG: hypothetical protein LBF22_03170, partial [Deltaproteobacteria bacterium]|nr:hypothetical protein [Deltaproteobacteria bacterium]
MPNGRKGLSLKKAIAVYFVAFALILVHESDRVSTWLEDMGRKGESAPFALLLNLAQELKSFSIKTGIVGLKEKES